MKKKETGLTGEDLRLAIRRAMALDLADHKTVERLSMRGMIREGEKISVGEAIARLRLMTELDDPSPGGFEKLSRELDGGADAGETCGQVIEIRAPKEYLG